MNFISRAEAGLKIRQHWLETYTREQLLAVHEPAWERLRNYELEKKLESEFGGEWCISEWCPFNGIYCTWRDQAPDLVIDEASKEIEDNAEALKASGLNPIYMLEYLRLRSPSSAGA